MGHCRWWMRGFDYCGIRRRSRGCISIAAGTRLRYNRACLHWSDDAAQAIHEVNRGRRPKVQGIQSRTSRLILASGAMTKAIFESYNVF
ncbi:MAG: hypothetical protein ACE361_23805 [Aureliella sp.]